MPQNFNNLRLTIELIPKTCWFSSVRTNVSKKDWDTLRHISYASANHVCQICGDIGKNQGYKHNLECHEIWDYNDNTKIQKLIGLISLCPRCHQAKHIGRSIAMGQKDLIYQHLCDVNKINKDTLEDYISYCFEQYVNRSKHQWFLDISLINKDPYNIKLTKQKTRKYKKKRWSKKRPPKKKLK